MGIFGSLFGGGAKETAEAVSTTLDGLGSFAGKIRSAITGEVTPDKKAELERLAMDMDMAVMKAQTGVNAIEASNSNVFVSGWRPFCGWVCGFGLGFQFIARPLLNWFLSVMYGFNLFATAVPPLPALDMGDLLTILAGMLGMGAYRTVERAKGVHRVK